MVCNNKDYTLTFNENVKGWTSFHSFHPDWMLGMNNQFFSFYGGDLFLHDSDDVRRNEFYGIQYPSKVSVMFNNSPSDIKEIKAISLEGSNSWDTLITAYISSTDDYTRSTVKEVEFVQKEGVWYAYARRNEDQNQLDSKSAYGIGKIYAKSSNGSNYYIYVTGHNNLLTVGDNIVKGDLTVVGKVIGINQLAPNVTMIQMDSTDLLEIYDFVIGMKDARIEGGNLRGYTIRMDLETTKDDTVEIFAVNSEVMKSFP